MLSYVHQSETATGGKKEKKVLGAGIMLARNAWTPEAECILAPEAVQLLARLHRTLEPGRQRLLAARETRQERFDAGELPDYLPRDSEAASGDWKVAPVPADLQRRRVEITGPVNSAKMVINMLSRTADGNRADTAMLDFEDSMKPSWKNVIDGMHNIIGAAHGKLQHEEPARGKMPAKLYRLDPGDMAVMMVRVRGLHLQESNLTIDGEPISAGLFDFVLSFYHTARDLILQGKTPKYYVPKCEHHEEAAWWNELFCLTQRALGVPVGTLRATFLIETLPAAYQMEEILFAFRDHAAGLNVGRWDKIFSDIKVLRNHPDRVVADRGDIHLGSPWMLNYAKRLIKICHARGAFALGGMAAFTPGKSAELREEQIRKVAEDKQLENALGHDGCWVSHPYFIATAMAAFPRENQLSSLLPDFCKFPDLLPKGSETQTLAGLRKNVRVGIAYLEGWRRDIGCVAWDNLMEDLATLEISRAQTWQWLNHGITLAEGEKVTPELVERIFQEEFARIETELAEHFGTENGALDGAVSRFAAARDAARQIFLEKSCRPFLSMASDLA